MTRLDLSPLFRSTIGFDHLDRLVEAARNRGEGDGYPPYNIVKTGEDAYHITMALAGFGAEDLSITAQDNILLVAGNPRSPEEPRHYLHRGIAGRAFERRFQLADFIKVAGAELKNGLLDIELVREVPEAMRPRTIKITTAEPRTIPQAA